MTNLEQMPFDDGLAAPLFLEMSSYELERFLEFVAKFLSETQGCLGVQAPARELDIVLPLIRSHLRGRLETPSSLIAASGVSRGTAYRMIDDMIARGLITRRPRTKSGKTFSLHPSEQLIRQFLDYARRMKSVVGSAFGLSQGTDYFFGASYLSASIIPPLPVQQRKLDLSGQLRVLLHADPAFLAMQKLKQQFELHFGTEIDVRALSLDRLREEILDNAGRPLSRFDIVTCDLCWMAELIDREIVLPIDDLATDAASELQDFHPEALETARRGSVLFGVPVQTTPELLIYRTDIFAARDLQPPVTVEQTLALAKRLHDPSRDMSGICWNGARGTPVGTTFMMLMADFGQPVINLPRAGDRFIDRDLSPENYRPALDSQIALEAANFLLELREFSPANVLQMSWFERAQCYAEGRAAMAYCYTQIMPAFENDPDSPARGHTGYALHPSRAGRPQIAPLGGWNLCIPSNIRPNRTEAAKQVVRTLTSAAATKLYIENGSMVSSRFSVCNDPAVAHNRPIIPIVDRMARAGQLQAWPRPAVPELSGILGDEVHTMLLRNKNPQAALRDAQARCDRLMRDNGRY
ncbi:MAG: extracellular solute-binding protein [Hyphomicrobiales bacterium]|nr:extracellular solute-binding protein [Hyphomicrobiales bacterium]